jgi:hypothetical protein
MEGMEGANVHRAGALEHGQRQIWSQRFVEVNNVKVFPLENTSHLAIEPGG